MNKQSKECMGWQTMWNYSDRNMQKYYVNPEEWHMVHFSGMSWDGRGGEGEKNLGSHDAWVESLRISRWKPSLKDSLSKEIHKKYQRISVGCSGGKSEVKAPRDL